MPIWGLIPHSPPKYNHPWGTGRLSYFVGRFGFWWRHPKHTRGQKTDFLNVLDPVEFNGASFSTNWRYGGHFDFSLPHKRHPKIYASGVEYVMRNWMMQPPVRSDLVWLSYGTLKTYGGHLGFFQYRLMWNLHVVTFWAESCYILDQLS